MNKQQLDKIKAVLQECGITFTCVEQRIVAIDNQRDKETIVLTCQVRIAVADSDKSV